MIFGIGTDIVKMERIHSIALADYGVFRIFTKKEHDYCRDKHRPQRHYAARWAAKEAFFKAWGDPDITKANIEVVNEKDGQPTFRFHNTNSPLNFRAHLSLSHDGEYAIAYVIVEG